MRTGIAPLLFVLVVSLFVASCSGDPSTALRRVGGQGMVDFYVAGGKVASNRQLLEARLRKLCDRKGGSFCELMVWADPASVPRALPMSDTELRAQIAQYIRNRNTGYDCFFLLRNGDVVKESLSGNCR